MKSTKSTLLSQNNEEKCGGQAKLFGSQGDHLSSSKIGKTLVPSFSLNGNLVFWTKFA